MTTFGIAALIELEAEAKNQAVAENFYTMAREEAFEKADECYDEREFGIEEALLASKREINVLKCVGF